MFPARGVIIPAVTRQSEQQEREHFFGAAKIMAALTLTSRVLGMVRDMAITWLGATRTTDAFQVAFAIPNLFRRLFGEGALASAFVPVFTETTEKSGFAKAARLLANALGLLTVFLLAVMILVILGLLTWGHLDPGKADRQLLITLLNVMMPFMVFTCLLGLGTAALNCRGHFTYFALAPNILNVFMIAAALVVAPYWRGRVQQQLFIIALSVSAAGAAQVAGVLWLLKRGGFSIRPRLWPVESGIRQMFRLMAPMLLGVGLLQISSLFDYVAAWVLTWTKDNPTVSLLGWETVRPLTAGVLVRYNAANRLYQFPMGVLAISLGVAVFPLLSRYAARNDMPNLRDSLNRALRLAIMEGLASATGLFVLAEPIIRLIFQHGRFRTEDTVQAVFILQMYLLGMWAYCSYQIFTRTFYSLKDVTTPLKVSCSMIALYMAIVLSLVWRFGAGAFGIATATTMSLNTIILSVLLRRRLGRIGGRKLVRSVARSLAACGVMALVLTWLLCELTGDEYWLIPHVLSIGPMLRHVIGLGAVPNWAVVTAAVPAGAAAFVATAWLLRAPELGELFGALRNRGKEDVPAPSE